MTQTQQSIDNRRRLRVCMLAYAFYENDNRIMRYAESLVRRGDDVDVVCIGRPEAPRTTEIEGVRVFRLQSRQRNERTRSSFVLRMGLFLVRSARWIASEHHRRPYDVIHVHNVPDLLVFSAWLPKRRGCRVILDIHDLLPEFYCSKFRVDENTWIASGLLAIERLAVSFADHVIVSNDLWKEKLVRRCAPTHRTTALANYVDLHLFRPVPRSRNDERWIVVYAGGLQRHQGVDILISAIALVGGVIPNVELHLYGDGPEKKKLRTQVSKLDLADVVIFHDPQPIRSIPTILANADVGVVPKRADLLGNEAYSTKILEMMSQDVPVVVAATAVDVHYFDPSVVCFFEPGNANELAQCLIRIRNDADYRRLLVLNAREYILANNWDVYAVRYFRIIDELAGGPTSALHDDS